jgi:hypothetical protein
LFIFQKNNGIISKKGFWEMNNTDRQRLSRIVYFICLAGIAGFFLTAVICRLTGFSFVGKLSDGGCRFRALTGYYCPGCGGTRAVDALLKGRMITSLRYHPVVVYLFAGVIIFAVSHTLNIISRKKIRALLFRESFFYVMIGLIVLQWIIKNAIYFFTGVHII